MTQKSTERSEPKHSNGNLSFPGRDIDVDSFLRTHPSREVVIPEPAEVVVDESPTKHTVVRDANGRAVLGQEFLDATNAWRTNPEGDIEKTKLTIEGKAYIAEIKWVFDRLKKNVISSRGREYDENPVISGMPLDEYMIFIKEKLQYREEYDYIREIVRELQYSLREVRQATLAEFPVKHVLEPEHGETGPAPRLSVFERIEVLQALQRSQRFSPPKSGEK